MAVVTSEENLGMSRSIADPSHVLLPSDADAVSPPIDDSARRDRAWSLVAFGGVVGLAAFLYVWNLTVSGFANTYYSAAAQAASQSWSAFFFGSLDAANFITIDKPPFSTWIMGLSVRLFGLSPAAILLPEALAGVATVAVLFATVRRSFGAASATIAGLVMALTPGAVLMFRYNNPDAVLTLLLVIAAALLARGLEAGRIRWAVAAAVVVGLAFLTKYLQAYLVLPAFALVWLVAAPGSLRWRIAGLAASALSVVLASGWWVAIVELIPTGSRPFIGGSETDSAIDLLLGYDGLGRLFGAGGPGGGGGGGGFGGFGGDPGLLRLFNDQFAGQVAWFLPLAAVGLAAGLWIHRRAGRTDRRLASYLLWGGWLVVHVLVFSLMSGIIHSYYTVALAPAIAALVGPGVVDLWQARSRSVAAGVILGAGLAVSGWLAWQILGRTPDFAPGLGPAVLAAAVLAGVVVALPFGRLGSIGRGSRRVIVGLPVAALVVALAVLLAGPAAYAADTMAIAYAGGDPSAGPAVRGSGLGGFDAGGRPSLGNAGGVGDGGLGGAQPGSDDGPGPPGSLPGSPPTGGDGPANGSGFGGSGDFGAGTGGPTDRVSTALTDYLVANRGDATWLVAVNGANQAGAIQLQTGVPVMAMGGFSGSDPAPTLDELKAYVASGELRFVMGGGGFGGGGFGGAGFGRDASVSAWLADACSVVDLGSDAGTTLHDCAGAG
jgi:4-amino-4-deoxy-L-arabinose transferase-like glycosyltransferase